MKANISSHPHRCTFEQAMHPIRDEDVCLVGNSPSLLEREQGEEIDSYECVIRMNKAVHNFKPEATRMALGSITHVRAGTKMSPASRVLLPSIPWVIWWLGVTSKAERRLFKLEEEIPSLPMKPSVWVRPPALERQLATEVGSRPSSGVSVIDLCISSGARSITTYGVDWWGEAGGEHRINWWQGNEATESHNPANEFEWFKAKGFSPLPDGRWRWER